MPTGDGYLLTDYLYGLIAVLIFRSGCTDNVIHKLDTLVLIGRYHIYLQRIEIMVIGFLIDHCSELFVSDETITVQQNIDIPAWQDIHRIRYDLPEYDLVEIIAVEMTMT